MLLHLEYLTTAVPVFSDISPSLSASYTHAPSQHLPTLLSLPVLSMCVVCVVFTLKPFRSTLKSAVLSTKYGARDTGFAAIIRIYEVINMYLVCTVSISYLSSDMIMGRWLFEG